MANLGCLDWVEFRADCRLNSAKQMGPALLPTPLSPARGRFVSCVWFGKPPLSHVPLHTWQPVSSSRPAAFSSFPLLRASSFHRRLASRGFHRRSRRHPTLLRIACFPVRLAGAFLSFQPAAWHSRDHYSGVGKSNTCRISPEGSFLKLSPAKIAALTVALLRIILKRSDLHFTEALCMPSLESCVDSNNRIFVSNNPQ